MSACCSSVKLDGSASWSSTDRVDSSAERLCVMDFSVMLKFEARKYLMVRCGEPRSCPFGDVMQLVVRERGSVA